MAEYRYRLPPCPAYDIPAMERWLEELAAKGLHLAPDGFFGPLVTFEEGPPRRERFRLEPTTTNGGLFSEEYDPEADAVELHRQMGWTYRARRGQFHIYSADDPHAPELHTDPQVQAITLASLTKHLRKQLLGSLVQTAIYALLLFGDVLITGSILLGSWRMALLAALLIWDLGRSIRALAVLTRFRRLLQRGEALPQHDGKKSIWLPLSLVRGGLWVFLVISMTAHILPLMTEEPYIPLDAYPDPFPFATMEDLYPDAQVERMDGILHSQVYRWSDFLAPENYDFTEFAELTREGQKSDCYLSVNYHRTRWEWTARQLAREFVSHAGGNPFEQFLERVFGGEPLIVTELAIPDADYCAYFYKNSSSPWVVIQKNNVVIQVNMDVLGGADPDADTVARQVLSQIP